MTSVLDQAVQLFNAGQPAACLEFLQQRTPDWHDQADGHVLLGATAHTLGNERQAREAYQRALQLQPQHAMASFNLALLEVQSDRFAMAIGVLESLLQHYPGFADARLLLADCYQQERREADGAAQFAVLLEQAPQDQHLRSKYAQFLNSTGHYARAALNAPGSGDGLLQLATACVHLGLNEAGRRLAQQGCEQPDAPDNAAAESLRLQGLAHMLRGEYGAAVAVFEQALHSGLNDRPLLFSLGWCYLAVGRFEEGWPLFRLRHAEPWCRMLNVPEWNGEPLHGKTILVHSEQGVGDIIFAIRYLPMLAAQAGRVIFSTYSDVLELLRHEQRTHEEEAAPAGEPGNESTVDMTAEPLTPDYQVRLMDLPGCLGTRFDHMPVEVPYLFPSAAKLAQWQERLGPTAGLRVGMVWGGNAQQVNDRYRSTRLADWRALACVPGIEWVSLQKGPPLAQLQALPAGWTIRQFDADVASFADTAAMIAQLDVVITVCTSVAHLAGAMGREVWLLVTSVRPDFRWPENAGQTPWYPSARLFRRAPGTSWAQLIRDQVQPALAARVLAGGRVTDAWTEAALHVQQGQDASGWQDVPVPAAASGAAVLLRQQLAGEQPSLAFQFAEPLSPVLRVQDELGRLPATLAAVHAHLQQVPMEQWPADWHARCCQLAIDEGQPGQAIELARGGLEHLPLAAELHYQLGRALWRSGEIEGARAAFARALELDPLYANAANNLGCVLQLLNRLDEATDAYQRAVELDPQLRLAWQNLATLAAIRGNDPFTEACWQRVNALAPDWTSHMHLGVLLYRRRALQEALVHFEKAVELGPDEFINHQNIAACWREINEDERAIAAWKRAVQIKPDATEAWMGLAWMLLSRGDMQEGWPAYARGLVEKPYPLPRWDGSPLGARSLLVVQDQGYGDLFQFVNLVHRIEGKITLAVNHAALTVLQDQNWPFPVIRVDDIDWNGGAYDCYVEQMRLPALMGADLHQSPAGYPYLRANTARMSDVVGGLRDDRQLRVGFVWSGSSRFKGNATRSTHLSDWRVIKQLAGVHFYSLQKDEASNQALDYPDLPLINLGAQCNSFADTAAVMTELDLVISTCTAVAHLAGALGRPTWVLLTSDHPDWRWMKEREDCPWYPSVRLFRQQAGETWAEVLQRVMQQLVREYPQVCWGSSS